MGNKPTQILRPVSRVCAQNDIPLCDRTAVLGAFFDPDQKGSSGILVVTTSTIENFSPKTGGKRYVMSFKNEKSILQAVFSHAASLGPCVLVGCRDRYIRVYHATSLTLITEFSTKEEAAVVTNIYITALACPSNNAVVVGFSDGTLQSYFLATRQLAATYAPPKNVDYIYNSGVGSNGDNEEPLRLSETPVQSISFHKPKNRVVVGHGNTFQIRMQTPFPGKSTTRLSDFPVIVYSLEKATIHAVYIGAKSCVLATHLTDDGTYLLCCTQSDVLVFNATSKHLIHQYNIFALHASASSFLAAVPDPKHGIIFLTLDDGCLACLKVYLPHCSHWNAEEDGRSNSTHDTHSASSAELPRCLIYKLFEPTKDQDNHIDAVCSPGLRMRRRLFENLWYESRTQTLIVGNDCGEVRLAPDFFSRSGTPASRR